jgi:hypothetical protein
VAAPFQPISVGHPVYINADQIIVAGDFTGNGKLDLAVANRDSTVSVLLGNGDGTFQPQVTYPVGNVSPNAIVAGDFTGSGRLDLAVAGTNFSTVPATGEISVLLGNGDGTFQSPIEYAAGSSSPVAIVAGDFTGAGKLDLAVADLGEDLRGTGPGSVSVLLGKGDGTFQPAVQYAVGSDPLSIVTGDFTSDGHLDLAVAAYDWNTDSSYVAVLLGNGNGTFRPAVDYPAGDGPVLLVAGDFNRDGHLDLAVADGVYPNPGVSVLLGNGDGTFQPPVEYTTGVYAFALVARDFTGNGHLDLAVDDVNGLEVLPGNGDGTFQPAKTLSAITNGSLVAGDFNGDGRLDFAIATLGQSYGSVTVLLGNGDGTFQNPVSSTLDRRFPVARS